MSPGWTSRGRYGHGNRILDDFVGIFVRDARDETDEAVITYAREIAAVQWPDLAEPATLVFLYIQKRNRGHRFVGFEGLPEPTGGSIS
jgi:hypothetical protein